jgi:glycerophosphoryl diester phosphodiesterase
VFVTKPSPLFEVHGHRGAQARLPENTLEGIRFAIDAGADAIEVDVALTKDKVAVLSHDRTLSTRLYQWTSSEGELPLLDPSRLEELGLPPAALEIFVKDVRAKDLEELDVGSKFHSDFPTQQRLPGARMPRLDDFVALMMSSPLSPKLNIEIKTHPILVDETLAPEDFAEAILKVLLMHKVPYERVLFQSFDPRSLLAVKGHDSRWRASFLVDTWSDDLSEVGTDLGLEALSPRWDLLNAERMRRLHGAGLEVYAWTPNLATQWKTLADLGVKGIITDDPEACLAFRSTLRSDY